MNIGERLRKARRDQKLTIDEIASLSGLSRPYISQVETGKASPSIPSLEKIAGALNMPMSRLFEDEESDGFRVKYIPKEERQVLLFGPPDGPAHERKSIHFLSSPEGAIEFSLFELAPGFAAGGKDHHHQGEEIFYVVKGDIVVEHGEDKFSLGPGDCIHVNATITHRIINTGDDSAEILVSRTPPGFSDIRIDRTEGHS